MIVACLEQIDFDSRLLSAVVPFSPGLDEQFDEVNDTSTGYDKAGKWQSMS